MFREERNPFFNVRKEKLETESGILLDKIALVNDETGDVLGIVSPSYELVTNKMVDDLFAEALGDLDIFSVRDHLDSTTRRWKRQIVFKNDNLNFEITTDDVVGICLEVFNGLDARTAFGYNLMGYRYICENGLVMGQKRLFSGSYAHYQENPARLREEFEMKFNLFKEKANEWSAWQALPFPTETFERFVLGKKYVTKKVGKDIVDSYEPTLNSQKLSNNKWGAFNVLTYLATHETKARKGSNVFSNRYNTINRLAADIYTFEDNESLEVATAD